MYVPRYYSTIIMRQNRTYTTHHGRICGTQRRKAPFQTQCKNNNSKCTVRATFHKIALDDVSSPTEEFFSIYIWTGTTDDDDEGDYSKGNYWNKKTTTRFCSHAIRPLVTESDNEIRRRRRRRLE